MSHSTVAHKWFHQLGNQRTKRNFYSSGNMFYDEKIIYSYGRHFAIAIRFDNLVLLNSKRYSNSTSKHKGHVQHAIDTFTHNRMYVPFKEAYRFPTNMKLKEAFKCIDFGYYVNDFNHNLKKLGNARKPEIYLSNIDSIKKELNKIFRFFRGSKTYALKTKGLRKLLNFEFDESTQLKLKNLAKKRLEKLRILKEKKRKEALQSIIDYENHEKNYLNLTSLPFNTAIRVKGDKIETSKGVKVNLNEGVRVFKLWEKGKAIGVEIKTLSSRWKCTKANGIIKFGCHEIDYDQAKRVLTPYLV